ncbi:hypothetical protein HK44_029525 (plasmid) [Pseudomonas fluorescens HK44]|uniref:Uncharacterized protein n=1 Tax=Pseudomonas fluorescens HK44 TaxID=1042209 RepID=A0A010RDT7_PSEFL|nr:hypothetical protein HK44_029525 [Pseudomonas fluorescens HK44]
MIAIKLVVMIIIKVNGVILFYKDIQTPIDVLIIAMVLTL